MSKPKEINLPESFTIRMKETLGSEFDKFLEALSDQPPVSVRYNPQKYLVKDSQNETVPWCRNGFYLESRPEFFKDPLIFAGAYYVQEASSMFVDKALEAYLPKDEPVKVLDLCAAPGGKSTLINSAISSDSLLLSNEIVSKRAIPLAENLMRWGNPNVLVANNNPQDLEILSEFFDVILVDAPCSGEGMFRKDKKVINLWGDNLPQACAQRQEQILESVDKMLKPGGLLIYSTCTFSPEENEEQVRNLVNSEEYESLQLPIKPEWGITELVENMANNAKAYNYRFYPHKTRGEGFFLSCLRKLDDGYASSKIKLSKKAVNSFKSLPKKYLDIIEKWVKKPDSLTFIQQEDEMVYAFPKALLADLKLIDKALNLRMKGVELGKLRNNKFIPSHHLAVSQILSDKIPVIELDYEQAVYYLKKQEIEVNTATVKGWAVVSYEGVNLGWIKVLPNRINNYYPIDLRIRKDFEIE
ncbi:methyltransferase RsmF C-terminal domain-like protein [Chondrinema litorale]|uniref:methyltransferase RsmF C-terminal domain-like protein n=1 Tax=Chondrinema litorale TaxID=2994555 RepID=UPI0025427EC3|nr:RNA methyltransferase [Chondrinema litorale]UZR95351.1 RNA methyltransferase [Chondrinema litorale]